MVYVRRLQVRIGTSRLKKFSSSLDKDALGAAILVAIQDICRESQQSRLELGLRVSRRFSRTNNLRR
jgi:hypothetical protein